MQHRSRTRPGQSHNTLRLTVDISLVNMPSTAETNPLKGPVVGEWICRVLLIEDSREFSRLLQLYLDDPKAGINHRI
jgi:hypothetical protein